MTIGQSMLQEFDQEMATTRRLLERVPSDKGEWKPHARSFPLGHLAQLVSRMPDWLTTILTRTELDLAAGGTYTLEKTEDLLAQFDRNVRGAREALAAAQDTDFDTTWSLKMGAQVLSAEPRRQVVRSTINHLVHHRGQLTVYLRLLDVPLPSIYGPTADEGWSASR
jgi:uncharacterized damage-inducible protein DinB